jgi:putative ABC transport system permease protein
MSVIDISWSGLLLSLLFVVLAGLSSFVLQLGLHKDIFWGVVRTVSQLFLMGFLLKYVFQLNSPGPVLLVYAAMVLFAAQIISGRVKNKEVPYLAPTIVSMFLSYTLVTYIVTAGVIQVEPWYKPSYFLPIGGMVIGNSMNAIALSLERLFGDLRAQRDVVEMFLSLGADYREASGDIFRRAVSAGMIPSINSMMGVGLVFLPGMMSGQILAGADPLIAVKYQIVVMLMLVGSTALGSFLVTLLARRMCFSASHSLLLGRD